MSTADVDRLVRAIQMHPELLAELRTLDTPERRLQWAREKGYPLTAEELEGLCKSDQALSDDELEMVAGGDDGWTPGPGDGGDGGDGG